MKKKKCPKCGGATDAVAIKYYKHCYKCESLKRKKANQDFSKFINAESLSAQIFFWKIWGKGYKQWKKRSML